MSGLRECNASMAIGSLFVFNDTATTEIYTLSLHDALPISARRLLRAGARLRPAAAARRRADAARRLTGRHDGEDRKSTRLNSSHANISYAAFCLKKKHCTHAVV